jgi:hypothetical protein
MKEGETVLLQTCKQSLLNRNVNPASSIDYNINAKVHTLSLEEIISAYLQAEKKEFFVELFEAVLKKSDKDLEQFFEQMGKLLLMSSLSVRDISLR